MSDAGPHEKQTLAPPPGADDVYTAPTLAVDERDADIRRLIEAAREDGTPAPAPPPLSVSLPPRRIRRIGVAFVAVGLGLLAGALVAWWLVTR